MPQARGAYFYEQGNRAIQAGRIKEALRDFDNAYRFDPSSDPAGLALARNYQSAQPTDSDSLYARLNRQHVAQRAATAQDWFRGLIARGAYPPIAELAAKEILADASRASPASAARPLTRPMPVGPVPIGPLSPTPSNAKLRSSPAAPSLQPNIGSSRAPDCPNPSGFGTSLTVGPSPSPTLTTSSSASDSPGAMDSAATAINFLCGSPQPAPGRDCRRTVYRR